MEHDQDLPVLSQLIYFWETVLKIKNDCISNLGSVETIVLFLNNNFMFINDNASVIATVPGRDKLCLELYWLCNKLILITIYDTNNM